MEILNIKQRKKYIKYNFQYLYIRNILMIFIRDNLTDFNDNFDKIKWF